MKLPLILAIDTSCDDTSAAVTQGTTVLSNVIASQTQLHKEFGGVFPTVAKQAHKENIVGVVGLALRRAGVTEQDITAIAVTQGPGLAPALEVGLGYAQELAKKLNLPLLPINHIEAHAWSAMAQPHRKTVEPSLTLPQFPILSLVISGGHSEFILIENVGQYQRLGFTIDDAAGEVLDKVGRMLDLGYPAGPIIEQFAKLGDSSTYKFPLPMTTSRDFNLSFSGMKTAGRNLITNLGELTRTDIYNFCASFQKAVFRAITYKLEKILLAHPDVQDVWLGGGVAANMELRRTLRAILKKHHRSHLHVPYTKKLCADNAAMIGVLAGLRWAAGLSSASVQSTEIDRRPRWLIDQIVQEIAV